MSDPVESASYVQALLPPTGMLLPVVGMIIPNAVFEPRVVRTRLTELFRMRFVTFPYARSQSLAPAVRCRCVMTNSIDAQRHTARPEESFRIPESFFRLRAAYSSERVGP